MLSFARVRALAFVAVLVIFAGIVVFRALGSDQELSVAPESCPEGFVPADMSLGDASEIKLNVYNGTGQAGLATQVGENFANRGFEVLEREDAADSEVGDDDIAVLRYGPAAVGAAHVVQAYFLFRAESIFQIEREDDVVDIIIGSGFRQLATETEVRQAIAGSGNPDVPPGTCPAEPES
jgi:hypothetical protein